MPRSVTAGDDWWFGDTRRIAIFYTLRTNQSRKIMARFLVTGCAGFIGSRLLDYLIRFGYANRPVGIDDLSWGYKENVPAPTLFVQAPVEMKAKDVFQQYGPFSAVFHLAAYAAEAMSPFCRSYTYWNNIQPTAAIVNEMIKTGGKLVYTSSTAVYGKASGILKESSPCQPMDPYANSKLCGERDIQIAGEQHGLDYTILRLSNVFGGYQSMWSKHRNVLALWMRARLEDEKLLIFGDGQQKRPFTYIDDVLPAMYAAAINPESSRKVFNIASPISYSVLEAAQAVMEVTGGGSIKYTKARHESKSIEVDCSAAQATLKFDAATPLHAGIGLMWEFSQRAWLEYPERRRESPIRPEITEKMPEVWR